MTIQFEDGKEYLAKSKLGDQTVVRVMCYLDELYILPMSENVLLADMGTLEEFDFVKLPDNAELFDMLTENEPKEVDLEAEYGHALELLPHIDPKDAGVAKRLLKTARTYLDKKQLTSDYLEKASDAAYEILGHIPSEQAADIHNLKYDAAYNLFQLLVLCAKDAREKEQSK